nr:hypothetical protein [Tanacetum cinerariifolium]
ISVFRCDPIWGCYRLVSRAKVIENQPEEEDGDDEKYEEDSIEYLTSEGDDDVDDDGDDLSEDDADDEEEEEESSDSEEEEEEHLAPTIPALALHSSIPAFEDSDETEPFEEGKTTAIPPPFGYRVASRISVQPHILMPFRSESEVERLLAIPTPPLSPISPTSYPLPPFLMPLPIFTSLPTSSFLLPSSLPSTSGSEIIPKADIPLQKRARFTTPTGGYEGVIGLTLWFEKMESVFNISNYTAACQVKYAVCTLQGVALTWWNSHVKTVTLEVAQALPWKTLKKMMTDKYCPRGKIKKLETEMWELKTKGTDVKYIGGVPDTIHDSVKATKPKTMQEAIEFATKLMDKRIRDDVKNKRKFEGTFGNNQNHPQQNKRQNTSRAYAAGNSDRNMYTEPKPLCSKCDYHHEGPCPPRCNNCKRVGHLTRDCRSRPANANNNN